MDGNPVGLTLPERGSSVLGVAVGFLLLVSFPCSGHAGPSWPSMPTKRQAPPCGGSSAAWQMGSSSVTSSSQGSTPDYFPQGL